MSTDILYNLLKQKVWTTHAPWDAKCPYDMIEHTALKNRNHLMNYAQIKQLAPNQELMFAFDARDTHLLRLDLEHDADQLWKNVVLNLPCAYFEYSQHHGIHALLPVNDQMLNKYPTLFNATNIKMGQHNDLELFPNAKHFMNFTANSFHVNNNVLDQVAQAELINNFLASANKIAKQHVDVDQIEIKHDLPANLKQFGNFVYRMLYKKSNMQCFVAKTVNKYTKTSGEMDASSVEFAVINKVQQNINFWSGRQHLQLNDQAKLQISVVLSKQVLCDQHLQRNKWNKSINGYDYLTWSNLKALQVK